MMVSPSSFVPRLVRSAFPPLLFIGWCLCPFLCAKMGDGRWLFVLLLSMADVPHYQKHGLLFSRVRSLSALCVKRRSPSLLVSARRPFLSTFHLLLFSLPRWVASRLSICSLASQFPLSPSYAVLLISRTSAVAPKITFSSLGRIPTLPLS